MDRFDAIGALERIGEDVPTVVRREVLAILDLREDRQREAIYELRRSGRAPEVAAVLIEIHRDRHLAGLRAAHIREVVGRDLEPMGSPMPALAPIGTP